MDPGSDGDCVMIGCSACSEGWLMPRTVERYDISSLVGLEGVTLAHAPALICDACGAMTLESGVLDRAMQALPAQVIEQGEGLLHAEVRFLRKALGLTQSDLADRLGVHRTTVARWETGEVSIARAESIALRALVAMRLLEDDPALASGIAAKFNRPGLARTTPPYVLDQTATR